MTSSVIVFTLGNCFLTRSLFSVIFCLINQNDLVSHYAVGNKHSRNGLWIDLNWENLLFYWTLNTGPVSLWLSGLKSNSITISWQLTWREMISEKENKPSFLMTKLSKQILWENLRHTLVYFWNVSFKWKLTENHLWFMLYFRYQ